MIMGSAIAYACISIALGLVLLLFGVRFMKLTVAVLGFLIGAGITSALLASSGWDSSVITIVAIAGGIAIASVAFWFYEVAITLSIAYFFGNLAYAIAISANQEHTAALVIAIAVGVVGFILLRAINVVDKIFALITSVQGANSIVVGIYVLLYADKLATAQSNGYVLVMDSSVVWLIGWVVLAVLGFIYQVSTHKTTPAHT